MKHYGMDNPEGSWITNLTTPTGTSFAGLTPNPGELYFRTDLNELFVHDGTNWSAIGSAGTTITNTQITATAGQTSFSVPYIVGNLLVHMNGAKLLDGVDYTATNGTTVDLTVGATAGDVLDFEAFTVSSISDFYTKTESDSKYAILGSGNVFTEGQTISRAGPYLDLKETDTTDKDFRVQVASGYFYITNISDVGVGLTHKYIARDDSKTLQQTSTDITYDGQSIARVGTANTFTADQSFDGGFNIQPVGNSTNLRVFNKAADTYWIVSNDDGTGAQVDNTKASFLLQYFSTSLSLWAKGAGGGSYTKVFNTDPTSKLLELQATDITYGGRSIRTYVANVTSTGNFSGNFPAGWTVAKTATGTYRVTHNLGFLPAVVVSHNGTANVNMVSNPASVNYFDVYAYLGGTLTDVAWAFHAQLL